MAVPSNFVKTLAGKSTVMGFRMIQCGRQTVSVIQPDGQIKQFQTPIKVSDLLLVHPHHYVTFASATTGRRTSGSDSIKAEIKRHWNPGTPKISPENDESGCFVPRRSCEPDMEIIFEDRMLVIDTREDDVEKETNLGRKLVNAISTLKIVSS